MKMTVLVLGGSYFIGKSIVAALLQRGYTVYTLNRGSKPADSRVTPILCDRNDEEGMRSALGQMQFDMVVDVSGTSKRQMEIICSAAYTEKLRKYLFISSSAVYAVDELSAPYKETDMLGWNKAWTSYGTNKIESEEALQATFLGTNTGLIILRPPYVYGENNYAYRESFVFDHIHSGRPLILPGSGETKLQFIFADDLAQTVVSLLDTEEHGQAIYNVGNKSAVTMNEWVELCEEAAGKTVEKLHFDHQAHGFCARDFFPFFDYDNVLDTTKIATLNLSEELMSEGLQKSYQWYLENREAIARKAPLAENEEKIYRLINV